MPGRDGGRFRHPTEGGSNQDWWPNQLNLKILRKHPAVANPMGADFDYAAAFNSLDIDALTRDVDAVHDGLAGLVARRLRPLRRPVHPHGVAQRGHLPRSATAAAARARACSASPR